MQITGTFLPLAHQVEYNHVSLFSIHKDLFLNKEACAQMSFCISKALLRMS